MRQCLSFNYSGRSVLPVLGVLWGLAVAPGALPVARADSTDAPIQYQDPYNFEALIPGQVYHGGSPADDLEYRTLKEKYHIKTIIELRGIAIGETLLTPWHRQQAAQWGMNFLYEGFSPLAMGRQNDVQIDRILLEVANRSNQPVYFHCRLGDDRTMLISALFQNLFMGRPAVEVDQDLKAHHFSTFLGGFFLASARQYWADRQVPQGEHHNGY